MIGGLLKSASVAAVAASGVMMGGVAVQAADLGGNCCADLEERVAELEATTVRKGNRKVSVELSGHVNEAILFWDDGFDDDAYIVTNNFSRTRFRIKGSAKINADWSAGYLLEFGLRRVGDSGGADQFDNGRAGSGRRIDIRHQALYVKSNTFGTVWLGHTAVAVDGIADICLGCTVTNTHEANLGWGGFAVADSNGDLGGSWATHGAGNNVASGASRREVLRYISPTVAGFVFSADWGADGPDQEKWSVALRYAGEFGAIRVAGGVGFFDEDDGLDGWGGSLSMMHTPTGLFIAGSYGEADEETAAVNDEETTDGWSVTLGIAQKWSALGKTTFWGRYGEYTGGSLNIANQTGTDSTVWALGINQKIDAAAMELYVTYWNVSGDFDVVGAAGVEEAEDFQAVMTGARIKF